MTREEIIKALKTRFVKAGQAHVFDFYEDLEEQEKSILIKQLRSVNLEVLEAQIISHISEVKDDPDSSYNEDTLKPSSYIQLPENGGSMEAWESAQIEGERAIRSGRLAAFTVAGGQGTRLGFDGPKGILPVSIISKKSFFEVFADKIMRANQRYDISIPWFIMTSEINHRATIDAFEANNYFGLKKDLVSFFPQSLFPAVDFDGKIIMEAKNSIARSPNGHGGAFKALVESGAVEKMKKLGVDVISYFQIDNPLIPCIDPIFIGFHLSEKSELSSKMIPKAYPLEKVGTFCEYKGKDIVIEYSDMPKEIQEKVDSNGEILYRSGSVAIHLFDRNFVEFLGGFSNEDSLPYHKAIKKIPYLDRSGINQVPEKENGIKFEMFVFDALAKASKTIIIEGLRNDNFSPVKNTKGVDSLDTCHKDQMEQSIRWLEACGVFLDNKEGKAIEINYRFAMDKEDFIYQWSRLKNKPSLKDGTIIE